MGYYRRRKSDARWQKVAWSGLVVTWGVLGSLVLKSENPHHPIADADSEPGGEEDVATDAKGNFTYLDVSASRPQPDGAAASQPAVSAASSQGEAQASAASQIQVSRSSGAAGTPQPPGKVSPKTNPKTAQPQPAQPNESSANPGKVSARPQAPNPSVASISDRPMLTRPEGANALMDVASQTSLPLLPSPTISAVEQSAAELVTAGRLEAGEIAETPLPEADPQALAVLSGYATCSDQASFKPASASAEDWLVSETRFSRGHSISVHPFVEQPVSLTFSDDNLALSNLQAGKHCEIGSRSPMVSMASN